MQVRHLQFPPDIQVLSTVGFRGSCLKRDTICMLDLTYEMDWLHKRLEEGDSGGTTLVDGGGASEGLSNIPSAWVHR